MARFLNDAYVLHTTLRVWERVAPSAPPPLGRSMASLCACPAQRCVVSPKP
jgi:hypothetical protein